MKITVWSRAYRSLRKLENFELIKEPQEVDDAPVAILGDNETLIGVYRNPDKYGGGAVFFTDQGVYFGDGQWTCVPYREIRKIEIPDAKSSRSFSVQMRDGSRLEIPLRGGEGRLRDHFAAHSFFRNVMTDKAGQVGTE